MKKEDFYYESQVWGQCGRHAMNFAFGKKDCPPFESEDQYIQHVQDFHRVSGNLDEETILNITTPESVDAEPIIIAWILTEKKSKSVCLKEIREITEGVDTFVESSDWIIIGVTGLTISIRDHRIHGGHFVTARRDDDGAWWIIDSTQPNSTYTRCSPKDFDLLRKYLLDEDKKKGKANNSQVSLIIGTNNSTRR